MKFKIFRFNKVKSTNNTAIRIIKNYNYDFGMILSDLQVNGREANMEKNGFPIKEIYS